MIKHLYWDDEASIALIEQEFLAEKPVLAASDTVFGLLAPLSEKSYNAFDKIKKRAGKPYLILVGSRADIGAFVDSSQLLQIEKLYGKVWPGPVTLICKAKTGLPAFLQSNEKTVAVRIPAHAGLQKLLKKYQGLFSTSANIAGRPVPYTVKDIDKQIANNFNFVVLNREKREKVLPSTIIDISHGDIRVVREGGFSVEKLKNQ